MKKFLDNTRSQQLIRLGIDLEYASYIQEKHDDLIFYRDKFFDSNTTFINKVNGKEIIASSTYNNDQLIFTIYDLTYLLEDMWGDKLVDVLEDQNWNEYMTLDEDGNELVDYCYNYILKKLIYRN